MDFSTKTIINSLKAEKRGNLGWILFFGKKIIVKNLLHLMLEMQKLGGIEHVCFIKMARSHMLEKIV